ncbi:RNA polymerase II, Rpb4 [Phaffia rhodozyma]|uniref:DNA-directed RNA polymerase III subunit RPC9 n=1 Tax=Phaffia rhodozyma TaxID=264483 RepID=A0A0F7ST38_PHARH|nr:RNA polymerase II, Rpb4 [Phaffia rhodozyma]
MEVIKPRTAFVSAREALEHLKSLKPELDLIAEANGKRYERTSRAREDPTAPIEEPSELEKKWFGRDQQLGLYQVVISSIEHFTSAEQSIPKQSLAGNQQLSYALQAIGKFTQVEILQITDLSPRTPVELYTVVEELFDRLNEEEIAHILDLVKASLSAAQTLPNPDAPVPRPADLNGKSVVDDAEEDAYNDLEAMEYGDMDDQGEDMGFELDEAAD